MSCAISGSRGSGWSGKPTPSPTSSESETDCEDRNENQINPRESHHSSGSTQASQLPIISSSLGNLRPHFIRNFGFNLL